MRLRKDLLMACVLVLIQCMSVAILRNFIALRTESLGAGADTVGLVVSSYSLLPIFLTVPGGAAIDRLGPKKIITLSLAFLAASTLIAAYVPFIWAMGLSQLIAGIAHMMVIIAVQSYVSNINQGQETTRDFGFYSSATAAGWMAGPLIGGALVDMGGFELAFTVPAILAGVTLTLNHLLPDQPTNQSKNEDTDRIVGNDFGLKNMMAQARELLKDHRVQLSLFVSMCGMLALSLRTSFYPIYMERVGYSRTIIGILTSVQSATALSLRPLMGILSAKLGVRGLLLSSLGLGAVGMIAVPFMASFTPLLVVLCVAGITPAFTVPLGMIFMSQGSDEEARGFALSIRGMSTRLILLIAPAALGFIVTWINLQFALVLSGAVLAAATIIMYFMTRKTKLTTETETEYEN